MLNSKLLKRENWVMKQTSNSNLKSDHRMSKVLMQIEKKIGSEICPKVRRSRRNFSELVFVSRVFHHFTRARKLEAIKICKEGHTLHFTSWARAQLTLNRLSIVKISRKENDSWLLFLGRRDEPLLCQNYGHLGPEQSLNSLPWGQSCIAKVHNSTPLHNNTFKFNSIWLKALRYIHSFF